MAQHSVASTDDWHLIISYRGIIRRSSSHNPQEQEIVYLMPFKYFLLHSLSHLLYWKTLIPRVKTLKYFAYHLDSEFSKSWTNHFWWLWLLHFWVCYKLYGKVCFPYLCHLVHRCGLVSDWLQQLQNLLRGVERLLLRLEHPHVQSAAVLPTWT